MMVWVLVLVLVPVVVVEPAGAVLALMLVQ